MMIQDPSRSRIRKIIQGVEAHRNVEFPIRFVECPAPLVRRRIQQSIEVHRARGISLPPDYAQIKPLIDGEVPVEHPVLAEIAGTDSNLVLRGAELLGQQSSGDYVPGLVDRPVLKESLEREFHQRVLNALDSPVVLDESQRRERVLLELDLIVRDVFDEEMRQRCAERLLDSAWVLVHSGQAEPAAVAAASATALLNGALNPLDIPWARESIVGLVNVDAMLQGAAPDDHVHGPDCDHGHIHGPDCDHGDDDLGGGGLIIPG
jgi:hypothetical protein